MAEISSKLEVISINDSQPEEGPIVPHERQVVDCVISIWKEDPSTENFSVPKLHKLVKNKHPNWSVNEKRVKKLLKQFGLLNNQEQFTYAKDIKSQLTPDLQLPSKVQIQMTSKRGKGLYAKKDILKGEVIWQEAPLFFIPSLANVKLIQHGSACAYCGKLLNETKTLLKGLDCHVCNETWCSKNCKQSNELHNLLKHNVYGKKSTIVNADAFLELQEYCLNETWNALYAITLIYSNILIDKTGAKQKQFGAMARVSQDIRYKALNSSAGSFDNMSGGALFVQEQQETLWKEGFEKFLKVFPKNPIDYKEYLYMMGTYNINNLDSNVYLVQSHLNHNCNPNTNVETETDRSGLKVIANKNIKAGEELTTTYINPSHTVNQRQRELRVNWGFICACDKCKSDLRPNVNDIRNMLKNNEQEFEIEPEMNNERRKSVRFDEKVVVKN
ncbi:unnamed protein product [Candida verbasci]|uniref:Histone-lysine N-methyltransferase SET5 n=1 Tax=Candida verbasci TaxID=1227364 RepID=A0A9W4TYM0_9ASCO|nr:unnamed protein product [Candida verbasci]